MKNLFTLGACALLCTTLFSCTADELETKNKDKATTEVKKVFLTEPLTPPGPGDDPIIVPPPPKKP
ncbi:hypothetical protein [Flavobacterium pectinovorum]|uniref:Lipoprotein n=1 Tax=Flavobacterium pectinovorum TaxID=29533 RepID=A0A502F0U1_9FLAO|nr:hypothetical protein [Flavobacterium pectinovorum]TPG42051.1 hypothetical protein EAH81_06925 [Flavobacterium pectinovorum]